MEDKRTRIYIFTEDFEILRQWQLNNPGLNLMGTFHDILEVAIKAKRNTHKDMVGKFDGKG